MKRRGVALKLFVVTSVLILLVFTILLLAQGLFFEQFYRMSKINVLEKSMNKFARQYKEAQSSERQVSRLLGAFMNEHDTSTDILNSRFERISTHPYYLELEAGSKTITIQISKEGMTVDQIPQKIQIGETLVVDGIFMNEDDTIMHPVVIQQTDTVLKEGLVRVRGKVTDLMLPERRSYNPLYQDALVDDVLLDWNSQMEQWQSRLRSGSVLQLDWQDKWSGIPYTVLIRLLSEGNEENSYLFVMTSMQPVGEAVGILKQYVVYLAPLMVLLAIVLSLIYSRIVSRPLVLLSRSAARLAKLDFTEQSAIDSKDEFGELSRSMVALSRNLDASMKELTHANAMLQEDVEEKRRSEQLRKELIANISHELKTPLGIVKGFAEGLQDGVASDKSERYLALIVNETDRMNALIMDMLELSKFEAKAIQLQPRSLALASLIQRVSDAFSQQLEMKQLQLRINADKEEEEELLVRADPRRLEQVILNFMSNAIRHAVVNSAITIGIQRTAPGKITTVIENIGPPIPEEDISRVWDHFYRAERSRDRKSGGTGLGLAITKHILELHGSEYGVENTKQGVAFSFTLDENGGTTYD
ncbi:cell wall metabolism sensor histidine kinase WalK [Bacillus sp. FJAT-26390]|uniref:sensor histidine kinase n=1 Tax=Bacillus sp. FJAT-26390 TaxID=1743142 RepID=UPI000807D994|nr:HAMP domain-containing sensor histidine kinase [Bacillus sp. FJAT-26390]OBZ07792.1 two-component sensor histidine kinase [Bacillus sp. FJAT-26390]